MERRSRGLIAVLLPAAEGIAVGGTGQHPIGVAALAVVDVVGNTPVYFPSVLILGNPFNPIVASGLGLLSFRLKAIFPGSIP